MDFDAIEKDLGWEQEKRLPVDTDKKVLSDKTITCADCGIDLLQVVLIAESKETTTIQAECPCGGTSYKYIITGKILVGNVVNMIILDVEDTQDKTIMKVGHKHE